MLKRLFILFLVLVLSLTAIACTTALPVTTGETPKVTPKETTRALSAVQVKELATESVNVAGEAQSYQFDMNMSVKMKMTGGEMNLDTTMDGEINGAVDYAASKMMMKAVMTMDIPYEGTKQIPVEMYLVGDWAYTRTVVPGSGEKWVKVQVTDLLRHQTDTIRPQIELLKASPDVTYLGEEIVDGVACYAMEVNPSSQALGSWLSQQNLAAGQTIDWDMPELANMFKEMSYRFWVNKQTKQLIRLNAHILLDLSSDTLPATTPTQEIFESMTMDMTMDMKLHDYNKPVNIELPAGADSAVSEP